MKLIFDYNTDFKPFNHGQFIDEQNDMLYLFGGIYKIFASFNLKTKKINYDKSNTNDIDQCNGSRVNHISIN